MTDPAWLAALRPELSELSAYQPEQGQYRVRLDANEAPALLSDRARARLLEVVHETAWERYPDATQRELRDALAEASGVTPDEVLAGAGSDELIAHLLTALSHPKERASVATVLTTTPTFVMYRLTARTRGLAVVEVPLDAAWDLDENALRRAVELTRPNLVFIASPNNPTGNLASRERLQRLIECAERSLVVIDEAYIEYADHDQLDFFRRYEHVAMLRTLSKVGFASLRVGWLIGRRELIREIDKLRLPYNLGTLSQKLATVVLRELSDEIARFRDTVRSERERMHAALEALPGLNVTPSQANFLWVKSERPAGELYERLANRGVLVRSFHRRGGRLAHQLRITLGSVEENDSLLSALREAL